MCCRDLAKRSLTKSCQEGFFRELGQRSHKEILLRYILSKSLAKRPLKRSVQRELFLQILYTDLARRPLMEILYGDLVKRAEALLGDHVEIA